MLNIGKGAFDFAQARFFPTLMGEFERKQLRTYTPCNFESREEIAQALAEVHVELMLIPPFRQGIRPIGKHSGNIDGIDRLDCLVIDIQRFGWCAKG